MRITYSANDLANKLWKAANFYDEFGLSPKTASLLYDASNIARSVSSIIDKNDKLKTENTKLRELARDMMHFYFTPNAIGCKQRETELLERARELGIEEDNGELWTEINA